MFFYKNTKEELRFFSEHNTRLLKEKYNQCIGEEFCAWDKHVFGSAEYYVKVLEDCLAQQRSYKELYPEIVKKREERRQEIEYWLKEFGWIP